MTDPMPPLTDPLPFFHHVATDRVLYIAPGPCPLVFSILVDEVAPRRPVVGSEPEIHPFGQSTRVGSLAVEQVRRELAEAMPLNPRRLREILSSWANFCDDVTDRLNDGETLADTLRNTWVLSPEQDIVVEDDEPSTALGSSERSV